MMTPDRIRAIRKGMGINQSQLAAEMRLRGQQTISEWERGLYAPNGPAEALLEAYEQGYRPKDWPPNPKLKGNPS